jgi:NTP pyrophosphatase (non-canonical NTP hydrolase)
MRLSEYQRQAFLTANKKMSDAEMLTNGVLGLAGEAGEVVDLVKKFMYQGHDLKKEKLVEELGDVLWYVGLISSSIGVDLGRVAELNVEKLRARYGEEFSAEKSINRED